MKYPNSVLWGLGMSLVVATGANAAPITFQQGVAYNTDITSIRQDSATTNANGAANLLVGRSAGSTFRILFEFDLSAIETAAGGNPYTIDSVTLAVTTNDSTSPGVGASTPLTTDLHLLGANLDFAETAVTWNNAPSIAGGSVGTLLTSGTQNVSTGGTTVTYASTAAFTSAVTGALAGADNTIRMLLKSTNETTSTGFFARLDTDEFATTSRRPRLVVNYTVNAVPEPATIGMGIAAAGLLALRRRA